MYDVIIIGARCAGSPTALYLARKGIKVLLVDRASFPSDVVSSHHIAHKGMDELRTMGLLDQVVSSGCPAIEQLVLEVLPFQRVVVDFASRETRAASFKIPFDESAQRASGPTYAPRRTILDNIILNAALRAGAEVRVDFLALRPCLDDDGTVVGIDGSSGGVRISERATIVVGADGMNSQLARQLKVPYYNYVPSQTCVYHSYFSGFAAAGMEFYLGDGFEIMVVPTHNELACIGVGVRNSRTREFSADLPRNFEAEVARIPDLADRFCRSRRVERFTGSHRLPNFFRNAWGRGWALVGDAGYHRDPISGRGISDAFRHARFLADAIATGLEGGEAQMASTLQTYQQLRDEDVRKVFDATTQLARLGAPTIDTFSLLNIIGTA